MMMQNPPFLSRRTMSNLHISQLIINSLTQEDLPLARKLHLQSLLRKRTQLFLRDLVEIRVSQTSLYSFDNHTVSRSIGHGLEVEGAAGTRLRVTKRAATADGRCGRHEVV